jgi:hypothetical protein
MRQMFFESTRLAYLMNFDSHIENLSSLNASLYPSLLHYLLDTKMRMNKSRNLIREVEQTGTSAFFSYYFYLHFVSFYRNLLCAVVLHFLPLSPCLCPFVHF